MTRPINRRECRVSNAHIFPTQETKGYRRAAIADMPRFQEETIREAAKRKTEKVDKGYLGRLVLQ